MEINELKVPEISIRKYTCEHGRNKYRCKDCGTGICEHGRDKHRCIECNGSQICVHKRFKYSCRECGGSLFCHHGKRKTYCKDCVGSQICEHRRCKDVCKECNGNSLCEHRRLKYYCKECRGSQICDHGRQRRACRDCNGASVCEHGKNKSRCRDCGGSQICEHGRRKYDCKDCGGIGICVHGRQKHTCKECGGASVCEHGRLKYQCRECKGSRICEHGKIKIYCKQCDGSCLCRSPWCEKIGNKKKYQGYCLFCFVNQFPDEKVTVNYKTKEKDVVERVIGKFPDFSWVKDKCIEDGCSRRRPDLLLDLGSHVIIVEVDEHKHEGYECSCENKRLMEISQDLQHRPVVFIRFNPDGYTTLDGEKVSSCWKLNRTTGLLAVPYNKKNEWELRIQVLLDKIQHWIDYPSEKTIEIVELFY